MAGLSLHVDGDRWRAHLRDVLERRPGLVPVAKGNGYGFGNGRLARRAQWLGVDTVAVGTYAEVDDVARRFDGDVLVLSPWRPGDLVPDDARIVHTVGRVEDVLALAALRDLRHRPRVVLERMTSMRRHGFSAGGLREAAGLARAHGLVVAGAALHLPLPPSLGTGSHLSEVDRLLTDVVAAGLDGTVWVSHLSLDELATLRGRWPGLTFRPRVGTELWLGDRTALRVRATVLDTHPVERGESFGYRGRSAPRSGHLVVVAGGTSHGIGLEAPTGDTSLRARAASLARGGLDAAGVVRSPYTIGGKQRLFAEPPHMQASMLFLPSGAPVPAVGDEVDVRVRFTTTQFDQVVIE
jgi:alanine racemase